MEIKLDREEADVCERLAKITAQLVREGVTFSAYERGRYFIIELLGGY